MNTKIILPSFLILAWIAFCAIMSSYRCCGITFGQAQTIANPAVELSAIDQGEKIAATTRSFEFSTVTAKLSEPVPVELQSFIGKIASYLQNHPDRRLVVTGLYAAEEKSQDAELGLVRAAAIESLLLDKSVPAIQIKGQQDMSEAITIKEDYVSHAIRFHFESMPTQAALLAEMKAHLNAQKIRLYFDLDAKTIQLTPAQRKFFEDLRFFLDNNQTQKVSVTGFTDNQGQPRQNKRLGRERAAFVRDFMIDLGIARPQILTDSQGEAQPISSNDTAADRAKNRRVEVQLVAE
ncbi:MAG: OmpA family protein [Bacteroidota bacterium]